MGFTRNERAVESQYDYFGARYYDARVGRFLSLDRYASKYPEYSPYSYGGNEPLGHIDVNGDSTSTPVLSLSTFGQSLFGSNSSSTGLERFQGGHVFSSIERAAGSLLSGVEKATGVTLPTLLKDVISGLAFPTVGPAKLLASGEDVLGTGYKGVQGAVEEGTTVYRVYGDAAKPFGKSWTTVDPGTVSNFRSVAGLPDPNTGRFMIEGVLKSTAGVTARQALPFGARSGGLPEVVIPNAKTQVDVLRVMGVNPPF